MPIPAFKRRLYAWGERYMYRPSLFDRLLAFLLLPLSLAYTALAILRRLWATPRSFDIPVVSIGNLTLGGSGKTPLTIALASSYSKAAIVLRGYGRTSKGMHVVSRWGALACDVHQSGDEAMLYAKMLPNALVIVSEIRAQGIIEAKSLGAEVVFLDDGFGKADIEKFDILIRPTPPPALPFCLPSGPYREPAWFYNYADMILEEGKEFHRNVRVDNPTNTMVLVTAIANPERLKPFLPQGIVASYAFPDHYMYTKEELVTLLKNHRASSLLVTQKDAVKLEAFNLPLSLLLLTLDVSPLVHHNIKTYIASIATKGQF